ncbi:cysteine-rich receptor kinase 2 [Olea europaea subsp. europaea]|uniref:Cysteine-rich receptor kinase 2 n=1 Tax=Olea europaea subsp. europaea TaxID=158383 RepID=A0A8S0RFW2_OLEEU|nr:cysteine-rich receptor kinase 2 [Olea europaea subsp. europaea]
MRTAGGHLHCASAELVWRMRLHLYGDVCRGDAEKLVKPLYDNCLNFKYSTLEKATGFFDKATKLGQGGFGTVYKGVLVGEREIAAKRFFFKNKHRAADFYNEVNIISTVEHKSPVKLLGCSFSGPESLLVYEFLPNKSLNFFIFDPSKGKALNREKRFEIVTGTSEGLAWKHFQQRKVDELFDPNLMLHNYHNIDVKNEIQRVVHVGHLCTQEIPSLQPSMSKVLEMLVKKVEQLPEPSNPPYIYKTLELNDKCEDQYSPLKRGNPASIATFSQSIFYPR